MKTVAAALACVVTAVAEGRITPGEAESLARVLETQMRVVEFESLVERVSELETAHTRTQTVESSNGSTLDWISKNYGNGPDAEELPLPGVSHEPSESME